MIWIDILGHSFSMALTTKLPYIDITSGDVTCYFILSTLDLVRPMHENDLLTSQVITKSRVVIWSDILYISCASTLKTKLPRCYIQIGYMMSHFLI